MNNIKYIALFILFTTLWSCNDNEVDNIFNDTPTERLNKRIEELKALLKSSDQGWKTTYFTDDSQLGGYTFLMKFTDNQVEMASDFNDEITTETSEWDVLLGATVKLSFTTRNKIHLLSDSDNAPTSNLSGQGYKGSFEFLYYGTENDEIIFRTVKGFTEVRFKKASENDWTNFQNYQDMKNYLNSSSGHLAYQIGNEIYNFSYNGKNAIRFATSLEGNSNLNFGVGFSSDGIIVSPAIDVNGTKYSEFTLNEAESKYVSLDGNFSITVVASPLDMSLVWRTQINPTLNSESFIQSFNGVKVVHDVVFPTLPLGDIIAFGDGEIVYDLGGRFVAIHNMSYSGVLGDDTVLNISKQTPGLNWSFVPHLNPMVDLIVEKSPYKVQSINPDVARLTSESDSDFWFIIIK